MVFLISADQWRSVFPLSGWLACRLSVEGTLVMHRVIAAGCLVLGGFAVDAAFAEDWRQFRGNSPVLAEVRRRGTLISTDRH
jgi:hypothetical protein